MEQKIYSFLSEKFSQQGSDVQYVTRHTLPRFLDKNHQKGFEIATPLNPIAQYCGYENWEEFKTLNPETISGQFPLAILQKGGVLVNPIVIINLSQKPKNLKKVLGVFALIACLSFGIYYYFYRYLPFRILTKAEINNLEFSLEKQESDQGRNPCKAYFKYDFSKLKLDSLEVYFGENRSFDEELNLILKEPKGEFVFDFYKAGVHEVAIKHQKQVIKSIPVYVKSHDWSCWYDFKTPGETWTNTNFKYKDFYTDGYLHLSRERLPANHRYNYTTNITRAEDFGVSMDSCTIEFKQKNSPDEEGISFYTTDMTLKNEFGKPISLRFDRNTGKSFVPKIATQDYNLNHQYLAIPMICYDWIKIKLSIKHNKVQLWINEKLWAISKLKPLGGQLKAICLESKGSGKWDDFIVSNSYTDKVVFRDNFEKIPISKDGY